MPRQDVQLDEPDRVASRARGRRRRQLIIDAATALLIDEGYDGLVLRDVAAAAKIHIGTLNYYFGTKQELLLAIFDQESEGYADKMRLAVSAADGREAQIQAVISVALQELAKPENALWRILVALAQHDSEAADLLRQENALYYQSLASELQGIRPELSVSRARTIGRLVWAMLDGYSLQINRFETRTSAEDRMFEGHLAAAVSGIVNMA